MIRQIEIRKCILVHIFLIPHPCLSRAPVGNKTSVRLREEISEYPAPPGRADLSDKCSTWREVLRRIKGPEEFQIGAFHKFGSLLLVNEGPNKCSNIGEMCLEAAIPSCTEGLSTPNFTLVSIEGCV